MKKKLPIGIQSFEKLRREGCYYVDKTPFIERLVDQGTYYFLSRPRRFGKSLFLDTLKQAFLGRRELFQGLYLEKNWDWGKNYPVIHIDFAGGVVKDSQDLESWILNQLELNQQSLGIECKRKNDIRQCFTELIMEARDKFNQGVAVLVDEYDKPILDRIEEPEEAIKIREVLKNFYSVLKPLDAYLKFVLFTGVSKFSKVSLFSGLNQLNDITLDKTYSSICGYTQSELEVVFAEEIEGEDLELLKCWYNGYSFMGEPVYNPFDVLLYFQKREYRPYWFETGTPEFLVKLLFDRRFYIPELESLVASERLLGSFDIDFIEPENLLFQTGYLTIKEFKRTPKGLAYYLGFPNKEVRVSLNEYLFSYYSGKTRDLERYIDNLYDAFNRADFEKIEGILKNLFSSIPYDWFRKNELEKYEGYYASVVYSFFAGAGFDLIAEDYTNRGRIDLTIFFGNKVYVIEFKVKDKEGESAIVKLREKKYHEKYVSSEKEVYLVGIDFSEASRNIVKFQWEKV